MASLITKELLYIYPRPKQIREIGEKLYYSIKHGKHGAKQSSIHQIEVLSQLLPHLCYMGVVEKIRNAVGIVSRILEKSHLTKKNTGKNTNKRLGDNSPCHMWDKTKPTDMMRCRKTVRELVVCCVWDRGKQGQQQPPLGFVCWKQIKRTCRRTQRAVCGIWPWESSFVGGVRNVFQLQMSVIRSRGPKLIWTSDECAVSQRPLMVRESSATGCTVSKNLLVQTGKILRNL